MAASETAGQDVDADIWRAIAGCSVQIPSVNSYVCYFPQGHLEHASSASPSSSAAAVASVNIDPVIPCQVASVNLLINPSSEQVFVKFLLQPVRSFGRRTENRSNNNGNDNNGNDVVYYSKILTPSDANNGGGFSVPRYCADLIFPPLDFADDPPAQNLIIKDTHNEPWTFRHIYRGTPRRHLLTTGWSKFVNAKSLIAGDTVVFMRKNSTNELFAGIRRIRPFVRKNKSGENFGTNEAMEAIQKAAREMAFEVVYYPRFGSPDFVVAAEKVEASRIRWRAGMQVKIAVETEDSSRLTWIQGTILAAALPKSGPWFRSPWRMLQVSWNDPEVLSNMERVSPWQVEYVMPMPPLQYSIPVPRKLGTSQHHELLTNGAGEFWYPMTELAGPSASMSGHMYQAVINTSPFPISMQGARQDHQIYRSRSSNSEPQSDDINPNQRFTDLLNNGVEPQPEAVLTEISNGQQECNSSSSTQGGTNSIQLFGTIIYQSSEAVQENINGNCTNGERNGVYGDGNVSESPPSPGQTEQCN